MNPWNSFCLFLYSITSQVAITPIDKILLYLEMATGGKGRVTTYMTKEQFRGERGRRDF